MSRSKAEDVPQCKELKGLHLGEVKEWVRMAFVARDASTWEKVKNQVKEWDSKNRENPPQHGSRKELENLKLFDSVDFKKEMIVAVFWGDVSMNSTSDQCEIQSALIKKDGVLVKCCSQLLWNEEEAKNNHYIHWRGYWDPIKPVLPYHIKVVPRSDLAVKFVQTIEHEREPFLGMIPLPPEKISDCTVVNSNEWNAKMHRLGSWE
jgi:hypothetical protein